MKWTSTGTKEDPADYDDAIPLWLIRSIIAIAVWLLALYVVGSYMGPSAMIGAMVLSTIPALIAWYAMGRIGPWAGWR
jgi:hypothetical protein